MLRTKLSTGAVVTAFLLSLAGIGLPAAPEGAPGKTLRVQPDAEKASGAGTGAPIRAAIEQLGEDGGILVIEPGRYVIRQRLRVPSHVTLRGASPTDTVLCLPEPTRTTADAAAGDHALVVSRPSSFRPDTTVQVVPPKPDAPFAGSEETAFEVTVTGIEGHRLRLAEPLPLDVPSRSRVGYPNHILTLGKEPTQDVVIENLGFDGGLVEGIPMPGHAKRCAIWGASPYTYAEGPKAPPLEGVTIRHCVMRNCYGRAVAFYNVAEADVIGCRISRIEDEAIDFDHFNAQCRAIGNVIRDAKIGIVLNDASHCTVQHNELVDCGAGIRVWWWYKVSPEGMNEHNVIEHNRVESVKGAAISLGEKAHRNTVRYNFVSGPVEVVEDDNTVSSNTPLGEE